MRLFLILLFFVFICGSYDSYAGQYYRNVNHDATFILTADGLLQKQLTSEESIMPVAGDIGFDLLGSATLFSFKYRVQNNYETLESSESKDFGSSILLPSSAGKRYFEIGFTYLPYSATAVSPGKISLIEEGWNGLKSLFGAGNSTPNVGFFQTLGFEAGLKLKQMEWNYTSNKVEEAIHIDQLHQILIDANIIIPIHYVNTNADNEISILFNIGYTSRGIQYDDDYIEKAQYLLNTTKKWFHGINLGMDLHINDTKISIFYPFLFGSKNIPGFETVIPILNVELNGSLFNI